MPEDNSICRDFERGVCTRGDNCKYNHPDDVVPGEKKSPICKDFQNKGCSRFKCKFLHVTVEEEAEYNSSGKLPEHGGRPEKAPSQLDKDVCRDFLNGRCDRGSRCRFSHVIEGEFPLNGAGLGGLYGKRPRTDEFFGGAPPARDALLLEENGFLKRKVADLEKEATDLRQMNDTLYEQNARYRSQLQKGTTNVASQVSAYSQVVYPQYSQAAYPAKNAALSVASALPTASAYSYHTY